MTRLFRCWIPMALALCAAVGTAPSAAQVPLKVGVLSLLGDDLQVITYPPASAGRREPQRTAWPTPNAAFDTAAVQAVDAALTAREPKPEIKLFTTTTRSLFGDPAALFNGGKAALPASLVAAMTKEGHTLLVLVTRSRQEAGLSPVLAGRVSGAIEGLGFVLDRRDEGQIGIDGNPSGAVLLPFVFVRVSLIDLLTLNVRREQSIVAAQPLPPLRGEASAQGLASMSAEQRRDKLTAMLEAELARVAPALVLGR